MNVGMAKPLPANQNLIWSNCAACAYKHLTAAYAALTSDGYADMPGVQAHEVYAARALIALRETHAGYPGNIALASGCLAMVEQTCPREDAGSYRSARKALDASGDCLIPPATLGALVLANIHEAVRELPEVQAAMKPFLASTTTRMPVMDLAEALIREIGRVADLYELHPKTEKGVQE